MAPSQCQIVSRDENRAPGKSLDCFGTNINMSWKPDLNDFGGMEKRSAKIWDAHFVIVVHLLIWCLKSGTTYANNRQLERHQYVRKVGILIGTVFGNSRETIWTGPWHFGGYPVQHLQKWCAHFISLLHHSVKTRVANGDGSRTAKVERKRKTKVQRQPEKFRALVTLVHGFLVKVQGEAERPWQAPKHPDKRCLEHLQHF